MTRHKTARFWHYTGAGTAVRMKLVAGQTLAYSEGGQTDEGYSYTAHSFYFDGEGVFASTFTNARDCDGVLNHGSDAYCPVSDLKAGYLDPEEQIAYPRWAHAKSWQRDLTAEAAGY